MSGEVFEEPVVVVDPPVTTTDSMMSAPWPPLPGGVEVTTTTVDPYSTLPEGVTVSVLPNGDEQYSGCVIIVECDDPRFDVVTVAEVGTADTLPATGPLDFAPWIVFAVGLIAVGRVCVRLQRHPRVVR